MYFNTPRLPPIKKKFLGGACPQTPLANSRLRRSIAKFQFLLSKHNPMPDNNMPITYDITTQCPRSSSRRKALSRPLIMANGQLSPVTRIYFITKMPILKISYTLDKKIISSTYIFFYVSYNCE